MRYIRYKYQKQQINFLNCNDINKWIDTCQTRVIGFDSVCESNCNCGEIRDMEYQPQYRTKKLNPNYSYECVDMDRHYKLQKQISYDNGITWMDIDEYEIGELYESNSPFCSAEVIIYDWFPTGRYKCVGYNKINEEVKRVSFDNGSTWSDLSFVDDNGNVTYEYRFNASNIEENCCDCGYREYEWRISNPIEYVCDVNTKSEVWYKWQYCPTDPSLDVKLDEMELRNPVQDEDYCGVNVYFVWDASSQNYCEFILNNRSYSATTENSVLNEDGTYTYIASLSDLGITEVTTRNRMFINSDNLLKVYKVPKSNGTSIQKMFVGCTNLTYLDKNAISDTSNVTNMGYMFQSCNSLTSLDLSNFNTSKITSMSYMFYGCSSLTTLDVSSFNTSAVTSMTYVFYDCNKLTSLDVSSFNTSNVTNMSYMFKNCNSLTSLDLSSFNTSNVTTMYQMFYKCSGLTSLNLSNWDTSNVTNMTYMFYGCNSLNEIIIDNCSCDTVSFIRDRLNEASLRNVLIYSNSGCEGTNCRPTTDREYNGYRIEVIKPSCEFYEVSNFNVYKVYTDTSVDINCNVSTSNGEELYLENQIPNRTNPSGNNDGDEPRTVTAYTDYGEYTFEQNYNTAQARTLIYEWNTNKSSSTLRYYKTTSSSISSSSFSTHPVNYLFEFDVERIIFSGTHITNLIQMVKMDSLTDMSYMFCDCSGLTSLDLSNCDTSKVWNMSMMFAACNSLTSLDLSSFDVTNVETMQNMFLGCSGLTSLDLSNWDTSNLTDKYDMDGMFTNCKSLSEITMKNCNETTINKIKGALNSAGILSNVTIITD